MWTQQIQSHPGDSLPRRFVAQRSRQSRRSTTRRVHLETNDVETDARHRHRHHHRRCVREDFIQQDRYHEFQYHREHELQRQIQQQSQQRQLSNRLQQETEQRQRMQRHIQQNQSMQQQLQQQQPNQQQNQQRKFHERQEKIREEKQQQQQQQLQPNCSARQQGIYEENQQFIEQQRLVERQENMHSEKQQQIQQQRLQERQQQMRLESQQQIQQKLYPGNQQQTFQEREQQLRQESQQCQRQLCQNAQQFPRQIPQMHRDRHQQQVQQQVQQQFHQERQQRLHEEQQQQLLQLEQLRQLQHYQHMQQLQQQQQQQQQQQHRERHQDDQFPYHRSDTELAVSSNPRASRNMAEKQRRDNLNTNISTMAALVPIVAGSSRRMDKISILRLAAAFLRTRYTLGRGAVDFLPRQYSDIDLEQYFVDNIIGNGGFFIVLTSTGKIVYVSRQVEQQLGHAQNELLGQSLYNFVYPEDHEELTRNLTPDESYRPNVPFPEERIHETGPDENSSSSEDSSSTDADRKPFREQRRSFKLRISQRAVSRRDHTQYECLHLSGVLRLADARRNAEVNRTRHREIAPTNNDVVFVGTAKLPNKRPLTELSIIDANKDEYVTRHLVDGRIIYCDHRISVVAGYLSEEVSGLSAFSFMHKDDLRWTIMGLRQMYDRVDPYGSSCYRLLSKTGEFIYLRTHGYLEYDKDTQTVVSFVCINTLVSEEEGVELVKEMKERFSATVSGAARAMIPNRLDSPTDSGTDRSNSKSSLEDPSQLEDAITHLISDLPSPAVSEDRLSPSPMPNAQYAKAAIFSQRLPPAATQASKIGIKKIDHYLILQGKGSRLSKQDAAMRASLKPLMERNQSHIMSIPPTIPLTIPSIIPPTTFSSNRIESASSTSTHEAVKSERNRETREFEQQQNGRTNKSNISNISNSNGNSSNLSNLSNLSNVYSEYETNRERKINTNHSTSASIGSVISTMKNAMSTILTMPTVPTVTTLPTVSTPPTISPSPIIPTMSTSNQSERTFVNFSREMDIRVNTTSTSMPSLSVNTISETVDETIARSNRTLSNAVSEMNASIEFDNSHGTSLEHAIEILSQLEKQEFDYLENGEEDIENIANISGSSESTRVLKRTRIGQDNSDVSTSRTKRRLIEGTSCEISVEGSSIESSDEENRRHELTSYTDEITGISGISGISSSRLDLECGGFERTIGVNDSASSSLQQVEFDVEEIHELDYRQIDTNTTPLVSSSSNVDEEPRFDAELRELGDEASLSSDLDANPDLVTKILDDLRPVRLSFEKPFDETKMQQLVANDRAVDDEIRRTHLRLANSMAMRESQFSVLARDLEDPALEAQRENLTQLQAEHKMQKQMLKTLQQDHRNMQVNVKHNVGV